MVTRRFFPQGVWVNFPIDVFLYLTIGSGFSLSNWGEVETTLKQLVAWALLFVLMPEMFPVKSLICCLSPFSGILPKAGQRGAAGETAQGVAGLLRDGGRGARRHAEELSAAESPPGHAHGGEVARPLPADPAVHLPVWWRGRRRWWRRMKETSRRPRYQFCSVVFQAACMAWN